MSPADPFGFVWIYHVLALSYKWTIDEIDKLTLPFVRLLMAELKNLPSVDIAVHHQNQAARGKIVTPAELGAVKVHIPRGPRGNRSR